MVLYFNFWVKYDNKPIVNVINNNVTLIYINIFAYLNLMKNNLFFNLTEELTTKS